MDLGAYAQIEKIEPIVKANNIKIDRVRGYRLMVEEKPLTKEEINKNVNIIAYERINGLLALVNDEMGRALCYGDGYERKRRKYTYGSEDEITGIKWSNVHGKLRRQFKYIFKEAKRDVLEQYNLWNKYAGQKNVLYIHAKLGASNWSDVYHKMYATEDWYLGSCNDAYDFAYCDIYAKISEETSNL